MTEKNKDICIVVARYNEDASWTKKFNNVIIYNKGDELDGYNNVIKLNNVGREPHTYYKHIYDNYDNLSKYTIFLQGNPYGHWRTGDECGFDKRINKYIMNENLNIDFEFIGSVLNSKIEKCPHHKSLDMRDLYQKIFGERVESAELIWGAGAQFIVSKNKILKHPRDFYFNIFNILSYSIHPTEAWQIERLHHCIFNGLK